jgi:hypothetical protein
MTEPSSQTAFPSLGRAERALAWANSVVAVALVGAAVWFILGGLSMRGVGPHGGFLMVLAGLFLVPEAVLFGLAAVGMFRNASWRWGAQLGPIIAPLTFGAGITWLSRQ